MSTFWVLVLVALASCICAIGCCAICYAIGYGHGWNEVCRRLGTKVQPTAPGWMQ